MRGAAMRTLKRNKQPFYYCLYKNTEIPGSSAIAGKAVAGISIVGDRDVSENRIHDSYGNETGELIKAYDRPVQMYANISPASGLARTEQFGDLADYDKVIVIDDVNCPITESTVLFVDKEPEYSTVSTYEDSGVETILGSGLVEKTYPVPVYDYIVRRVAKSLNSVSIAIQKVTVQ